jgi:hypothetical protein
MSSWKARLLMALTMLMMVLTMAAAPAMADRLFDDRFLGDRRFDDHLVRDPFLFDRVDDGTDVVGTTGDCIEVLDTDVDEVAPGIFVEEEEVKALLCPVFDANGNIIRWQKFRV